MFKGIRDWCGLIRNRGRLIQAVRYSSRAEKWRVANEVKSLGPWFHNYEVASGVWTNPSGDFPGFDYPAWRWGFVSKLLPPLEGMRCLDIGCSSGFFSLKLKELGAANVLGIDAGEQPNALAQSRFAAQQLGLDVEFENCSIYDVPALEKQFDLILCLGVFYHLRHPLLALEHLRAVSRGTLILQTITTRHEVAAARELSSELLNGVQVQSPVLDDPSFPELKFVEHSLGGDSTCWFVPNAQCVYAMLRTAGFRVEEVMFPTHHDVLVRCSAE